jgi:hypothetical protein
MPNLNVITWNSRGETAGAAADLLGVINYLTASGWQPHVVVVQEANAAAGGAIYQMLAGLGGAYNQPPTHAVEGGPHGRGYILTTHASVTGQGTFGRYDLASDWLLQQWIQASLSLAARQIATQELATMRMPATANLGFQGRNVPFLTWHVPRGPGQVQNGATLGGGANPDAFLFLQQSGLYQGLVAPGMNNLGMIAGDLNVTVQQLNSPTGIPSLPNILPTWVGVSDHLDHILAHEHAGQPSPTFSNSGNFPSPNSDHNILVSTVTW